MPRLRWFLEDVANKSGAEVMHVIAHSMGNRPVVGALNRIAESAAPARSRFRQIVLTAPDIDAATFRELAAALPRGRAGDAVRIVERLGVAALAQVSGLSAGGGYGTARGCSNGCGYSRRVGTRHGLAGALVLRRQPLCHHRPLLPNPQWSGAVAACLPSGEGTASGPLLGVSTIGLGP